MHRLVVVSIALFFWSVGILGEHVQAFADDRGSPWVSKVISIQGRVTAKRRGQTGWQPVKLNDTLFAGDRIQVEANSRAGIVLSNDAVLRLDQNTTLVFTEIEKETTFIFKLLKGAANFFSRRPRSLKILTPFVNGVVEGTEFYVQVDEDQTRIDLFEGRIRAENQYGEIQLAKGQGALATADSAPQRQILVKPRESVQWALYYPPVLALGPGEVSDELQASLVLSDQGRFPEAIDTLEQIPESDRDARFFTYRAALLLHVGRVIQARGDIEQALALDPNSGDALSLQAVIAVVQNEKDGAMTAALKAVKNNPRSAAAQMALSYAHQAAFNLPEALEAAQAATSHSPESGTAWARLAELRLSTGELDKGIHAARKAAKLNPKTAHAHTILGFAYLTQIKTEKARAAFEKAITQDSAAPLPRLGLGLTKIRDGDLEQGRADMEIAAGLDPLNALIRSYLGKAYFDEKRGPLDATQLEIAKTLDPNDPTPYFYSAIQKQTENRPVEALQDLQQSIALNDNRAVYRSRLLLDDDLAARSASLARIYSDLGFGQLSLAEGWKSVNTDPTNHSAHRLLADSYAALPRHEIARVSELLQSQLTQPINITPVSPQLAQSGLFILEGSGPGDLTFNEFHPLFLRNRLALQASGVVGENDTLGDEVVLSGVLGKFSYSLGQFHYETDGFRENNEQQKDIYNAFGQFNVTPATSIQAEYRYNRTQKGDLELTFLETFNPDQDVDDKVETYRFGLRHAFAPNKLLLGSFIYQDADLSTVVSPGFFELEADVKYFVGEVIYQTKIATVNFITGFGHRKKDTTQVTDFFGFPTEEDSETQFNNVYLYSLTELPQNMLLTVGGSGEFLNGATDEEDSDQFNPKLGLMWNPYTKTTLRAAVIRTLNRPLLSQENIDPTLEPTQVAGFNQFFLGAEGDETWHYGIGIDQVLSEKIFAGAEFVFRDVEERFIDTSGPTPEVEQYSREDYWLRSYLNWAANSWVTLSFEYLYEYVDREKADGLINIEEFSKLNTHKIPLSIKLFHPSGITAGVKAIYVDQKGDFLNPADLSIITDSDQFWVFDASIVYRLPKRYGIIKLEAKNLFDEEFNFQDTDPANPEILPVRTIYLRLTVSF